MRRHPAGDHAAFRGVRRALAVAGGALLAFLLLGVLAVAPLLRVGAPAAGTGLTSATHRTSPVAATGRERRGETAGRAGPQQNHVLAEARTGVAAAASLPGSPAADLPSGFVAVPLLAGLLLLLPSPGGRIARVAPGLPLRRGPPAAEVRLAVHVHPRPA